MNKKTFYNFKNSTFENTSTFYLNGNNVLSKYQIFCLVITKLLIIDALKLDILVEFKVYNMVYNHRI